MQKLSIAPVPAEAVSGPRLAKELAIQSKKCIECKLCRKECRFLQKYGSPKHIADTYDPASAKDQMMAFECSLCQLCAAVCPVRINPAAMFLEMRREAVARGAQDLSAYGAILNYEKRGTSKRYSYYGLPANCDTVLFPGCALPGTRPDRVKALFAHLRQTIPSLGIVLDCCTKPSHDLGRDAHFQSMFSEMKDYLLRHGVQTVLVACPNCHRVFREYGTGLRVQTVYEYLAATALPETANIAGTVAVHDPCGTRNEEQVHAAIRLLAAAKSLTVQEMKHYGHKTICCGEGGSVGCVNPDFAKGWGARRHDEAAGTRILTYCAGCANYLGALHPTSHILDLLFEPEATLAGTVKIYRTPWTYLNRLRLKSHFKRKVHAALRRERTFTGAPLAGSGPVKRLVIDWGRRLQIFFGNRGGK
jgi:Fe-S oxidoreductase